VASAGLSRKSLIQRTLPGRVGRQAKCNSLGHADPSRIRDRLARRRRRSPVAVAGAVPMKDVVYLLVTVVFFLVSWLYVKGLERL
jgi:hypothetical protein